MRLYRTGTRWCLWRWTEVDSEYITRLHLIKTPWFAICLHWILKPDPEPYLHDHPVTFLSLVLRGWYAEFRYKGGRLSHRHHHWCNWIRASREDRHSIVEVAPRGALTLCLMGPKTQEWGFHAPGGWIYWRDYYREQRGFR